MSAAVTEFVMGREAAAGASPRRYRFIYDPQCRTGTSIHLSMRVRLAQNVKRAIDSVKTRDGLLVNKDCHWKRMFVAV